MSGSEDDSEEEVGKAYLLAIAPRDRQSATLAAITRSTSGSQREALVRQHSAVQPAVAPTDRGDLVRDGLAAAGVGAPVKPKTLLTPNGSIHSRSKSTNTYSDESTKTRVIFRYDYTHAPDRRHDAIRP